MTDLYTDILPLLGDDPNAEEEWLQHAINEALKQVHIPMLELSTTQLRDIYVTSPGFVDRTFNPAVKNGPFANISFARCIGAQNAYLEAVSKVHGMIDRGVDYNILTDSLKARLPADILMVLALKGDLGDKVDEFKRVAIDEIMKEKGYSVDG